MVPDTVEGIVKLLAGSVGDEVARRVVSAEASALGLGSHLTHAEAVRLLQRLDASTGPAGLAARLALTRLTRSEREVPRRPGSSAEIAVRPAATQPRVLVSELTALFGRSLGDEKAAHVVQVAMNRVAVIGPDLDPADALRVLDEIAGMPGPAAVVARFAKARYMLA